MIWQRVRRLSRYVEERAPWQLARDPAHAAALAQTLATLQNFLIDRNILDVIERLAELSESDVVLEIGGGPGVLSERLAERARFLHVDELDRKLEENLRGVLAPFKTLSCTWATRPRSTSPGLIRPLTSSSQTCRTGLLRRSSCARSPSFRASRAGW